MAASNYGLADDFFSKDWVLFPDYTTPEIHFEHNFDEDISALEDECSPLDSGYYSNENLESSPIKKTAVVDEIKISHSGTAEHIHIQAETDLSAPETVASAKAGHDSFIYTDIKTGSTATIEKVDIEDASSTKSPSRSMSHDIDDPSLPHYSQFSNTLTGLTPLQSWVKLDQVGYCHELLAYRLEQPAKRRKTGGTGS